jgi:hypothetical protein
MPRDPVFDHCDQHYQEVSANTEILIDTVIPNGETWRVARFIGSGAYLDDTVVSLWWNKGGAAEVLLAAAHGDATVPLVSELTGDGAKKLSLVLTNDTGSAHVMGGRWDAEGA